MRGSSNLKPQDILILLSILIQESDEWKNKDIAELCGISPAEVTESLKRSVLAQLINSQKRSIFRSNLLEFIIHGIRYAFPPVLGTVVRGIPTAHSAEPLNKLIQSTTEQYVWASPEGTIRGIEITPLYHSVSAVVKCKQLYEILALIDAVRIGRTREKSFAIELLTKRISRE